MEKKQKGALIVHNWELEMKEIVTDGIPYLLLLVNIAKKII